MYLEEQGKSQDIKHIYMKCNVDMPPKPPKQKVKVKDVCVSGKKWQKQEKLAAVSLVLQFIFCLGVSANSICINLDG